METFILFYFATPAFFLLKFEERKHFQVISVVPKLNQIQES